MNLKRVRWRIQQELDSVLNSDHVLSVKKEPVLPMEDKDRTEWLLWCCYVNSCSMQEANHRYKHNLEMMKKMVSNMLDNRKARAEERKKKRKKRKSRI